MGVLVPVAGSAQHVGPSVPVAFDDVTVVDVGRGTLIPVQRVLIIGRHIQSVGNKSEIPLPHDTKVVHAQGKYLIPGLWDMHTHSWDQALHFYPIFLANGVTGIRDAGSYVPLDTLRRWRQEILAGTRVGPPRQVFSGHPIDAAAGTPCVRQNTGPSNAFETYKICMSADSTDARKLVDSLRMAGVDMLKTYDMDRASYFLLAAAARRVGMPFGGHVAEVGAIDASDSGAGVIDHIASTQDLDTLCFPSTGGPPASVARCEPVAEKFRRNGTWWVPTLVFFGGWGPAKSNNQSIFRQSHDRLSTFTVDSFGPRNWLQDIVRTASRPTTRPTSSGDVSGIFQIAQRAGLPMLMGTDVVGHLPPWTLPPGFSLHVELAMDVAEGLTAATALQAATLNPAKLLHATDSLGTVAPGKLADLVLLDADPLADITNTTTIRAVVADGRYFDRAALDRVLAEFASEIRFMAKESFPH